MPTYRQNELRWFWKLPVLVVATVFTYGQLTICIIATPVKWISKHVGKLPLYVSYHWESGCYRFPATIWNAIFSWQKRKPLRQENVNYLCSRILCQIKFKTDFKLQQQFLPTLSHLFSNYWDAAPRCLNDDSGV